MNTASHKSYLKHRDRISALNKTPERREKRRLSLIRYYRECIESWKEIIPEKTFCQCCNRDIYFGIGNKNTAIHFDHRREQDEVIVSPSHWLRVHKRTPENERIWMSCDFGMLCGWCNVALPTKNRKVFVKQVLSYIGGL